MSNNFLKYYVDNSSIDDWESVLLWDSEGNTNKHCFHEWKEYVGFTDKYDYCLKCDAKSK
jgi:hypothetical protein